MATGLSVSESRTLERRRRVHLELSDDFLRLPNQLTTTSSSRNCGLQSVSHGHLSQQQIERIDEQAAYALHQQLNIGPGVGGVPVAHGASGQNIRGRLLISVMQVSSG